MNAMFQEDWEASVLNNEAIEVHLSYLRPAIEKLNVKVDALDEKIDRVDQKLSGKIEAVDKKLTDKIDALDTKLTGKIDQLSERFMEMQASLTGFKWFIGSTTVIFIAITTAHHLGWI